MRKTTNQEAVSIPETGSDADLAPVLVLVLVLVPVRRQEEGQVDLAR